MSILPNSQIYTSGSITGPVVTKTTVTKTKTVTEEFDEKGNLTTRVTEEHEETETTSEQRTFPTVPYNPLTPYGTGPTWTAPIPVTSGQTTLRGESIITDQNISDGKTFPSNRSETFLDVLSRGGIGTGVPGDPTPVVRGSAEAVGGVSFTKTGTKCCNKDAGEGCNNC